MTLEAILPLDHSVMRIGLSDASKRITLVDSWTKTVMSCTAILRANRARISRQAATPHVTARKRIEWVEIFDFEWLDPPTRGIELRMKKMRRIPSATNMFFSYKSEAHHKDDSGTVGIPRWASVVMRSGQTVEGVPRKCLSLCRAMYQYEMSSQRRNRALVRGRNCDEQVMRAGLMASGSIVNDYTLAGRSLARSLGFVGDVHFREAHKDPDHQIQLYCAVVAGGLTFLTAKENSKTLTVGKSIVLQPRMGAMTSPLRNDRRFGSIRQTRPTKTPTYAKAVCGCVSLRSSALKHLS